ncbi:MAG: CtsR family transcriptional regulator [Oscillospiraceae bacterium]|nr:CtsR family transcriptional regulator [Oscillospiraceae bacterium]
MNLSNVIAHMISEMLEDTDEIEIQRNTLAQRIGCVPSQINYVLSSRFTPERGYIVESKRGGGGCIRITRVSYNGDTLLMHVVNAIGNSIDDKSCSNFLVNLVYNDIISKSDAKLILAATSDTALKRIEPPQRDEVRASIFKQMLLSVSTD